MAPPKVFISYSHDTPAHETKVLALANRLRGNGIDAVLDQYESFPPRGWIQWMKDQVRDAQFILVVCTETYRRRWDGDEKAGMGLGASYESQLIQQLLYDAGGVNERFVPVLLGESDSRHLPLELRRYTHFPLYTEEGYEGLYGLLTNQPKIQKPILGQPLPVRKAKPDFRNLVWNAPPRNPFFTGRTMHIQAIRNALTQAASVALTQPQAVSGLGGIGKTQTAIEYAHRYRSNYAVVLWSEADSRDVLLSGFAAFANLLKLPQKDEQDLSIVAAAVRRWMESSPGWLLVLDNVEDLALVRRFAPVGAEGHLLITTRLHATGEFAELVEMKQMEPEEGALFLLRRGKLIPGNKSLEAVSEADRALARQISIEMDGLPLALDQAAAFIEEIPSTLAEYLSLYREEGKALRARRGELALRHPSVTITFSLAFARVAEGNRAAADLVRVCAFLAPDAIPEEIFTQAGQELGEPIAKLDTKPIAWVEAVGEAGRFSLIHRDAENKSLNIHRLVQEVVKDDMDGETRRGWSERVVQALNKVFPNPEFQNWSQCERLLPHARVAARLVEEFGLVSAVAARLLQCCGFYLRERGQYSEAEPLFRNALDISEKALGPDHAETAKSLSNLGVLYRQQGRHLEAEPLLRRALDVCEKALGPDHAKTANNLNNLAVLYNNQDRYREAEPLLRRALEIYDKALAPTDPAVSSCLNNLAFLYSNQGRYSEAEPLLLRALDLKEKTLGPDHPSTAISLNNLALDYGNQGRYPEAEALNRRALNIREKVLGPNHLDTASSLNNLGNVLTKQGRYTQAEPLLLRSLDICEKALGRDNPYTATSLDNLSRVCLNQGRYDEAEAFSRRALEIYKKTLSPGHSDTATSVHIYASVLRKLGRSAEADEMEKRLKSTGG